MPSSENAELHDLIHRVFTETFGSAASAPEVFREVVTSIPDHLTRHLVGKGPKAEISGYFRTKRADGLPQAPEVDDEGTHKQLDLMTVPEYRYVIEQYLKSSAASQAQAQKLADLCHALHGVTIPLQMIDASA
ncbi:MAG: hypothetical protein PGN07_04615 [Aeromicrobium erythreum]